MKKIIAIIAVLLAFTVSAQAQAKKTTSLDAAKKDIALLASKIKMDETLKADLTTLMVTKHNTMSDAKLSEADKESASKQYIRKLMSALNEDQKKALNSDPELLKKLVH
jgi:Spy/CpxP family protein refolding chaperone